jgi:hypothetical protein
LSDQPAPEPPLDFDLMLIDGAVKLREGRTREARACFERILEREPGHPGAHLGLGDVRLKLGDRRGAGERYRVAVDADPQDVTAAFKYVDATWEDDLEGAVTRLEGLLETLEENLALRSAVLRKLLELKERFERIQRGEMPYHADRIDHLGFRHAADLLAEFRRVNEALLAEEPENVAARADLGTALFCQGDRPGAEMLLRGLGKGHRLETVTFDADFYARLRGMTDAEIAAGLPPVEELVGADLEGPGILYLACNGSYFRLFAAQMLRSLAAVAPRATVHLHLMDASDDELSMARQLIEALAPLRCSLSVEQPGSGAAQDPGARAYYHSVRYLRLHQMRERFPAPVWLVDVDTLVNRDPQALFPHLEGRDAAVRIRPGRLYPWLQFSGCVFGIGDSPAGLAYLRLVAAYVAALHAEGRLRWGVDQIALYGCFEYLREIGEAPELALLDDSVIDLDTYADDTVFWCDAGRIKFLHVRSLGENEADFEVGDRTRFVDRFQEYWNQNAELFASGGFSIERG